MIDVLQRVEGTGIEGRSRLISSERSRFMAHVVERSDLSHYRAYRMSRVFDQLNLGVLTQQLAAFDRIAEYRDAAPGVGWDRGLHEWIEIENQARAENSARHGVSVVYLPTPTSRIDIDSRQ